MAKSKTPRKTKAKRSPAQRAATKRMLAANKSKRTVKRVARKARKASKASKPTATKRRKRRASASASRAPALVRRVYVTPTPKGQKRRKLRVEVRSAKRTKRRKSRGRGRLIRTLRVNPAFSMSGVLAPITGVMRNFQDSIKSGAGIAGIAGGAIGAVAGGTLLARLVMPRALRLMPAIAGTPLGARAISATLYYGAGFLLAKFLPVNDKIKRGILAGAVAAAIIEVIRPGTVQRMVAIVPGVGPLIAGNLGGIEPELGDYVEEVLAGLGTDAADDGGAALVSGYELDGYELDGLGCSPSAEELVQFSR